jgi:outer membrane autotransporter protein
MGAATSSLSSTHHGREWSAAAELEYAMKMGAWQVRPMAGIRYANLRENGFSESGGVSALSVDARRTENTNLMAGARFLHPFANNTGGWEFRAAVSHLAGDNDSPISARLAGQPASFTANGTPLKRTALNLGAGVAGSVAKNVSAYADLAYETRGSGQDAYAVTAGLRVSW